MATQDLNFREFQKMVDHWITTTGVRYFSPLTNMAILAEETGEIARIMAREHGDQKKNILDASRHRNNPKLTS